MVFNEGQTAPCGQNLLPVCPSSLHHPTVTAPVEEVMTEALVQSVRVAGGFPRPNNTARREQMGDGCSSTV